jgi:hypothetical protein
MRATTAALAAFESAAGVARIEELDAAAVPES